MQTDGIGTPVGNEVVDDQGASSDDTNVVRLDTAGEFHIHNLSAHGWLTGPGARRKVVLRIVKEGHVDTLCSVIARSK